MQALLDALARFTPTPEPARVFHGRGGRHPGCEHLALDWFPPVWLLTSFEPLDNDALGAVGERLAGQAWVYQCRQAGGQADTRRMGGELPEPHVVTEAGSRFAIHLLRGQNHGLFLDMAAGRRWVREWAAGQPGGKVLNLFAYTCAFSVVALQAGAAQVTNVDMSSGALSLGRHNHALNGIGAGASFLAHDIFNSWGKLTRGGPYDLVICDPPSFQKGSFVATQDYARVARRLPGLLAPGGHALLCLNTPKLGPGFLQALMAEQAPALALQARLDNPAAFADADEQRSLKVLVYRAAAA